MIDLCGFLLSQIYVKLFLSGKTLPLGNLEFHPLSKLNRVGSGRSGGDVLVPSLADLAMAEETSSTSGGSQGCILLQETRMIGHHGPLAWDITKPKTKSFHPPSFHISKLFEIDNCKGNGNHPIFIHLFPTPHGTHHCHSSFFPPGCSRGFSNEVLLIPASPNLWC